MNQYGGLITHEGTAFWEIAFVSVWMEALPGWEVSSDFRCFGGVMYAFG